MVGEGMSNGLATRFYSLQIDRLDREPSER